MHPRPARTYPYWPLLAPLIFRSLHLVLPQTYFQPDEFWQALEPAHWLVFGYGHLTWEWRDLPLPPLGVGVGDASGDGVGLNWEAWYRHVVVGGRMRSWAWPGVFAMVYKALQVAGAEEWIAFAPRIIGVLVAALTDYGTYTLAVKLLGPGAGPTALLLSLTSMFNFHALPRALSTSPETLLTVWALVFFPLAPLSPPGRIVVGDDRGTERIASKSMRDVRRVRKDEHDDEGVVRVKDVAELDYSVMDCMPPFVGADEGIPREILPVAAALATLALCIRPTTLPFWIAMGVSYLRREKARGLLPAVGAVFSALTVLALSTALDYTITGRLILPILTFAHYNLLNPLAAFYGETKWWYHIVHTMPIFAITILSPFQDGLFRALLPQRLTSSFPLPAGLRTITRAMIFAIAVLSLSTHSEWRFCHPFLPLFLIIALPALFTAYTPTILGAYKFRDSFRQYFRLSKRAFYVIVLVPIVPLAYLSVHGRAQVRVMDVLRRGALGRVTGVVALMPCHATPWMSHLHRDVPAWFLTCEPPLAGVDKKLHRTEQIKFYDDPAAYLSRAMPMPTPMLRGDEMGTLPSHVLVFGHTLELEGGVVRRELGARGYSEVWYGWNGFDVFQDERERTGGVRVWQRDTEMVWA